ncbi:MAG TPA: hypothetical protein VD997_03230 [Phycisphaerales bacterium]|nr:hypothetical protein [Phycisphaerales bacterium]
MKPAALLLLAAACTHALAQQQPREPDPHPPTPAEIEQVAPTPRKVPQIDLPETIDAALARARESYRVGSIAERVQITVTTKDEQQRATTVLFRVFAGTEAAHHQDRRVFLDLGRLQIAADSTGVTAVTPREPELYFQAPVTPPITLDELWNAVPPVPLPQLEWALGEDTGRIGRVVTAILQASWTSVQYTKDLGVIFNGTSPSGPASAEFARDGRLVRLSVPLSREGDRIELRVTPEEAGNAWTIPLEGRKPVPSLADLRPRPPEIMPGGRLPALSLMTRDLDSWSLQDELDRLPSPDLARVPTYGLLVVYRPAGTTAEQDAEIGARAVTLARADVSHAQPDPTRRPRLVPVVIPVLDLADMNRTKLVTIDDAWAARQKDAPPRYFSPTGIGEMDRLARGSSAVVIIIDSTQKILSTIPLENRADAESVAQEIGSLLEAAAALPAAP